MTGYKLHRRGNPCPVCQGVKHCKTDSKGLVFCHSHIDQDPDIPGWKYKKASSIGVWGRFARADGKQGDFDREAWQRSKEEEKRSQKAALKNALDRDGRNTAIRRLQKHIGLARADRDRLKNRSLKDEQIDKYGFFSKESYQNIPKGIPYNLPGLNKCGKKLANKHQGIICPAFDYQGRAIGWQLRKRQLNAAGKYLWAVSYLGDKKISSNLPNGEKPISLIRENPSDQTLYITEGFLKPIVAACRHKINAIGCPNGLFDRSPKQFKEILSLGFDYLILCPDAGDIINPNVIIRWRKQIDFLRQFNIPIRIGWWGQFSKKSGDIDEVKSLEEIALISPEEFFALAEKLKDKVWQEWFTSLDFTSNIQIDKPYFDYDLPPTNSIFAIKSDMGTGKTTRLIKWIKELEKTHGIISLGYRNALLYQFCERTLFDHIHEKQALNMIGYDKATIALCVDSLLKFEPEDFNNKIIILDELTSIIRHLLISGTIYTEAREQILLLFAEAIRRSDRVIMLDGNMCNWAVEYVAQLAPDKQVIKIENLYQANQDRSATFWEGSVNNSGKINQRDSSGIRKQIFDALKPFIATDSQMQAEVYDQLLSAQGCDVLRIDSTTSGTEKAKEFLANCDAYIEKYQPDAVIITPSAESGIDVSIKNYFTHNFLIACGAVGVPALMQLGTRLRDKNAKMVVWANNNPKVKGISAEAIADEIIWQINTHDQISLNNRTEAIIRQALLDSIVRDNNSLTGRLKYFLNLERANLSQALRIAFSRKGFLIESESDPSYGEINKLFRETRVEIQKARSVAIHQAYDLKESSLKYHLSFDAKPEEVYARQKAAIKRLLPGVDQTEIWNEEFIYQTQFKHPQYTDTINTHYLFDHPQMAKELNTKAFAREYARAGIIDNMSLMNVRLRGLTALNLLDTGINAILDAPEEKYFTNESAEVIAVHKKLKRSPKLRQKLGIKNISKHPIHNVNRILAMLNKKLAYVKSARDVNGKMVRFRLLVDLNLDAKTSKTCYQCCETRWQTWIENEAINLAWEVEKNQNKSTYSEVAQMLNLSRLASVSKTYEIFNKPMAISETRDRLDEYFDKINRTIQKLRTRIHKDGFQNERKLLINTIQNCKETFETGIRILIEQKWSGFCKYLTDIGDFQAYQVLSAIQFFEKESCKTTLEIP